MAGAFDDEVEQTVSIQEYLKDVEEQELVLPFFTFYGSCCVPIVGTFGCQNAYICCCLISFYKGIIFMLLGLEISSLYLKPLLRNLGELPIEPCEQGCLEHWLVNEEGMPLMQLSTAKLRFRLLKFSCCNIVFKALARI